MNLSSFNSALASMARPALITAKTVAVGAGGAALTGASTAAQQYVATNGVTMNWQAIGQAAAAGAVAAAAAYFLTPPHVSTK